VQATAPPVPWELRALREEFTETLRAQNRSPMTVKSYREAVDQFAAFLAERGLPVEPEEIRRTHVEAFIADQLARWKPATAAVRYRSLQAFFKWCVQNDYLEASPMANMSPPKVPETPPRS
jgi:integrase/recombinase XerC